jgi:hypothetical protein
VRTVRGDGALWLPRWKPGEGYRLEADAAGSPVVVSYHFALGRQATGGWSLAVMEQPDEPVGRIFDNAARYLTARIAIERGGLALHAAACGATAVPGFSPEPPARGNRPRCVFPPRRKAWANDFAIVLPGEKGWATAAVPFDNTEAAPASPVRGLVPLAGIYRLHQASAHRVEQPAGAFAQASILACAAFHGRFPISRIERGRPSRDRGIRVVPALVFRTGRRILVPAHGRSVTAPRGGALAGLRVVDASRVLAGPYAAMLLGDLGADVIKVEQPGRGDDTRRWGPPFTEDGLSAYYLAVNRSKRGVAIDLGENAGREVLDALLSRADVLIENFKMTTREAFGLSGEATRRKFPRLVHAAITGFGVTGAHASRPGYDSVVQAASGLMSITGPEDGPPFKTGVAISDLAAGLHATVAILAALRHRDASGEGQLVDVSLFDASLGLLANVASSALVSGETPTRWGTRIRRSFPIRSWGRATDR